MTLDYAAGRDILDALTRARTTYDGDAYTALFADSAEVFLDPFAAPLVGHNALRAYLNDAAEAEQHLDLAVERHWVAGDAILAVWHASWNRSDDAKVRLAGFMVAEVGDDGRIGRLRRWFNVRPAGGGEPGCAGEEHDGG